MDDHSTQNEIEAGIQRDRASLASTLEELQSRVSVETLTGEAVGLIKSNAASYTKVVDEAIRANPLAVALTGLGIAWLIFGAKKPNIAIAPKPETLSRWEDDGGPVVPVGAIQDDWLRESDGLRARATAAVRKLEESARSTATESGNILGDGAQHMPDFTQDRDSVLSDLSNKLKQTFRRGLVDLSEAAQDRIVSAREMAFGATNGSSAHQFESAQSKARLIENHPFAVGALSLALGAALGGALPPTRTEDCAFGANRDDLVKAASNIFAEEMARARILASDVGGEITSTLQEVADSTGKAIGEKLTATADRVTDRVAQEVSNFQNQASDPKKQRRDEKPSTT